MQTRWKKSIAVLLCSVMLFLAVGAELAHQHCVVVTGRDHVIGELTGAAKVKWHPGAGFVCVGCIYALSHMAAQLPFQRSLPLLEGALPDPLTDIFLLLDIPAPFSNRAPPRLSF